MIKPSDPRLLVHAVAGGLCLLLVLTGWWIGLRPAANVQANAAQLQRDIESAEARLREKNAELEKLRQQATQAEHALRARPLGLRSPSSLNTQIGRYSQLAEQCGLDLSTTRVGDLAVAGDHHYFPFTLGGSGPMPGVLHLLGELHRHHPDTAIHLIDMTRNPDSGLARFEIKLVWLVSEASPSTASANTGTE
ncbi:MAG: hypothetical protein AAGH88_14855 [Planctomycetota bacterium]